jgi:hypothetical protein
MKPRKTIETVWNVRTYDVWGNRKDGYEVNDIHSCGTVTINCKIQTHNAGSCGDFKCATPSDYQLQTIFGVRCALNTDGDDTHIYVDRAADSYPIGELECESHDSLAPIRRYRMKCDRCQMLSVNGHAAHELGCEYSGAKWNSETGEWTKQRKCLVCGTVDADDPCCNAEVD